GVVLWRLKARTSAVIPTTVRQFISPNSRMCLPIASCPGQKRPAVSAFTIATGGLPDISVVEKERPDSKGTFITRKYSGETVFIQNKGETIPPVGETKFSMLSDCFATRPPSGSVFTNAAPVTPGADCT